MVKLEDLFLVYYKARANKRRSRDTVRFEMNLEANLLQLWKELNERTFRADSNYAFTVSVPKDREIFATEMKNRVVHHYLDWRMRPIYEKVLSDRSFNNRKGMGLHKAIECFSDDIRELTEGYTKDAWCFHLDLKGYFPNANVEKALAQQLELIDCYYEGDDKDDLKYMMTTCMRADPARHCNIYVPLSCWDRIAPEKSLFNKPTGTGAAIGFLIWQNAMGLYINDVVKWLQSHEPLRVVVFVDDIYVVTRDKTGFLALMPELRKRLAELDVRLNEKKFFCQHFSKGIRCLGTMLKFGRMYLNRTTVNRAFARLREWADRRYIPIDERNNMLCSLNTYCGMMKRGNNRKVLQKFKEESLCLLGRFLEWNEKKDCLGLRKKVRLANAR
jgi:hypothetical protein